MTKEDQLALFAQRLEALMKSTAAEFDLTGVEVVGILTITATRISMNILANPPNSPKKE